MRVLTALGKCLFRKQYMTKIDREFSMPYIIETVR